MTSSNGPAGSRTALVTGITGQDGYYLSKLLLSKGYRVHGIVRRTSAISRGRLDLLKQQLPDLARNLTLHYGDVTDGSNILRHVIEFQPDEIYNLAAQSHVRVSFDKPVYTQQVNADGALNVLEAARFLNATKPVRVYQASSSEMFGGVPGTAPQNESTRLHPRSPYACSKVSAFHLTVNYRESYGLYACNGILFNHESPQRGESFVTRKITLAAARIGEGLQSELALGNLEAKRDWGFAADYVEAMWAILQQDQADDFVVASGECHSVREFLQCAFSHVGLDYQKYVRVDPRYFRPAEVDLLCGDASKARETLGWHPRTSFEQLVRKMVDHDCRLVRRQRKLREFETEDEAADSPDQTRPPD